MSKISAYFAETTDELVNKTTWPSWAELQSSATLVLVASFIIAILVWAMDSGFNNLMQMAYNLLSN